ncbi:MAG: outer membrane protein assembly factor BamB [Halofilum sp. (in: g-proteobacteria)]|nr:outer membrane protein assembly factor BamB [Halofilum sp. (in: g-proteobacteria)]
MSRLRGATLGLLALLAAACSGVEDTAVPPAELTAFDPAARLSIQWRQGIGSAFSEKWIRLTPAVDGDGAFAANVDGTVAAYDLDDGDVRWSVQLDQWLSAGVGVDGERVYVGTVEGDVVALERANGREAWRHAAGGELLAPPVGAQGLVIARTVDGRVTALSATDGSVRWTHGSEVPSLSLRGNGTPLLVPGGVIVGLDNGRVVALAASNGQAIWETEIAPPEGRSPIERMVDIDGAIGIGRNVLYAATYQGQVAQVEPQQGRIRWSRSMSSYFGLSVDDQRVYVTDANGHVNALAPDSGNALWRQEKLDHRRITAPVPVPATPWLAVGDFEGYVHLLARGDGRIVARRGVGGWGILADPVPTGDGRFLVQTQGAELLLLHARSLD